MVGCSAVLVYRGGPLGRAEQRGTSTEKTMRTLTLSLLATLLYCLQAFGTVTSGMVLLRDYGEPDLGSIAALEVLYLSDGHRVVLVDAAKTATFSPDGRKVAFVDMDGMISFINVDGTGLTQTRHTNNSNLNWCTDGYIYCRGLGGIARIHDNGAGDKELVYTIQEGAVSPTGVALKASIGDVSLSLDGTRLVGTVGKDGGGYANLCVDLVAKTQWSQATPCQSSISASGDKVSCNSMAGGHHTYRVLAWGAPYEEFPSGNTWVGCDPTEECPSDLGLFPLRPDINEMYNLNPPVNIEIRNPKWSDTEDDIFYFATHAKDGLTAEAGGAYLVEFSTMAYTKVGPQGTEPNGFFGDEVVLGDTPDYLVTPSTLTFAWDQSEDLPDAKQTTLSSTPSMSQVPSISGQPAWLTVTSSLTGPNTCVLENSLVASEMPGEGTYSATVTVTPDGAAAVTYQVNLTVGPAPQGPIVLHRPSGGESFSVGDTMVIEYTADPEVNLGVIISLSTNAGETFDVLNETDALPTGSNLTFSYAIPDSLFGSDRSPGQVLSQCLLKLSNYPSGNEIYSQTFSVTSAETGVAGSVKAMVPAGLTVSVGRTAHGTTLTVNSPASGSGRILDMHGRTVRTVALSGGSQAVAVGRLSLGRYLFQADLSNGIFGAVPFFGER